MSDMPFTSIQDVDKALERAAAEDWQQQWMSASKTRNFCEDDPLLDWLDLFGETNGFVRDQQQPGYDLRTDFGPFILQQGQLFEQAVLRHLATLQRQPLHQIATTPDDIRSLGKVRQTIAALLANEEVICQAVLWDPQSRTYGAADLLIRSDVLE